MKTPKISLKPGTHKATVTTVNREPATENPTHVTIGIKLEGHEGEVFQKFRNTLKKDTKLRQAIKAILNRTLKAAECKSGAVLSSLVGQTCQITVTQKPGKNVKFTFTQSTTLHPNAQGEHRAEKSPKHTDKGSPNTTETMPVTSTQA